MEILFITSRHPPFDPRIYHKMFNSLKKVGLDVKILIPNNVMLSKENDDFISFDGHKGHWLSLMNNFKILIRCFSLRPKIIFFFDPDLLPFMEFFNLFSKTSIVYDNHEDYSSYIMMKESIPVWVRKFVKVFFELFFMIGKRTFDFITYADPFTSGIDLKNPKEQVIYNYPTIEFYPEQEKKFDLIYPGSIDLSVCQRLLAIADELDKISLHEIKFLIIGRDVNDTNKRQIEEFNRNHEKIMIHFKEDLPYEVVQEYISKSRIGLIPLPHVEKFKKNIPIKLFEYLMHSIPILASDLPPISLFLSKTEGNYCIKDENYSSSYSVNIIKILDNYPQYLEIAKSNYKILKENWNWNKSEKSKLLKIIRSRKIQ